MHDLDSFRTGFRHAALACSLASAALTLVFGWHQASHWTIALACAVFLVACSLASDYVWLFVSDAWKSRQWGLAATTTFGALFVLSLNLISNVGSVGWQRDSEISRATLQKIEHTDGRNTVADAQKEVDRLELIEQDMRKANGWLTSTTADALRAKIPGLELAISQEAKRGGCGPNCLRFTKERDDVNAQISTAERMDANTKALTEARINLQAARGASKDNVVVVAAPDSQAQFLAGMLTASLLPTDTAKRWTDRGIATWIAVGLVVAPILFSLIGWRSDRPAKPRDTSQLTTGFTRGRAPDAETAQAGNHRAVVIERTIDDTQFIRLIAQARRRAA